MVAMVGFLRLYRFANEKLSCARTTTPVSCALLLHVGDPGIHRASCVCVCVRARICDIVSGTNVLGLPEETYCGTVGRTCVFYRDVNLSHGICCITVYHVLFCSFLRSGHDSPPYKLCTSFSNFNTFSVLLIQYIQKFCQEFSEKLLRAYFGSCSQSLSVVFLLLAVCLPRQLEGGLPA